VLVTNQLPSLCVQTHSVVPADNTYAVAAACVSSGFTEKVVVDYENKRLVKEQHDQIESLKIVQAAASDTESAMGKSERTVV
jgi:hypothetical protein